MDNDATDSAQWSVPDLFKPAFVTTSEPVAALGHPAGPVTAFFGFGEDDRALPMENGLLVFRRRANRFTAVSAEYERGIRIDMLTPPRIGSVELRTLCMLDDGRKAVGLIIEEDAGELDNPILDEEKSRFAKLIAEHAALVPILSELDWFRNRSEDFFASRAHELAAELLERTRTLSEAERKLAESRESRLKNVGVIGVLKNAATSLGHEWLERQVRQAGQRISETREAMAANDEEAAKHRRFSLEDTIARLVDAEECFFRKYREFCLVRHFRAQFEAEIVGGRLLRNDLESRIVELRSKNAKIAAEIAELETRLPELRAMLRRDTESLSQQERALVAAETSNAALEKTFRESFEALVGHPPAFANGAPDEQGHLPGTPEDETGGAQGGESLSFRCPECGRAISVREDSDTYLANCPECGATIDLTELEPET